MKFWQQTWVRLALAGLLVAAAAIAVRWAGVATLYDLHIDEITYNHFAETIQAGHLPLLSNGEPFFLHPPGYFAILAVWRAFTWHGAGDIFVQYDVLRGLNVALSGATAAVIFGLSRYLTKNTWLGVAAAAIYIIDPLAIRHNTRSLIETSATLWVLLGFLLTFYFGSRPSRPWHWILSGLVFGMAVVTKDMMAIFIGVAFVGMVVVKSGVTKAAAKYLAIGIVVPYAVWLVILTMSGELGAFLSEKTLGLRRFLGLLQVTGYNSHGTPTKSSAFLDTLTNYGTSYVIMGAALMCTGILLLSRSRHRRRWGCVSLAATAMLAYCFVFGTMEEQFLYYLLVPGMVTVVVAALEVYRGLTQPPHRRAYTLAGCALAVFVVLYGAISYTAALRQSDNGWEQTVRWTKTHVPEGSKVTVFAQGQFLFDGAGYRIDTSTSYDQMIANNVNYVLIPQKLADDGYLPLPASETARVVQAGKVVFRFDSRDSGTFRVVELPRAVGVRP